MLRPAVPSDSFHISGGSTFGCADHCLLAQRSVDVVKVACLVELLWIAMVRFTCLVFVVGGLSFCCPGASFFVVFVCLVLL